MSAEQGRHHRPRYNLLYRSIGYIPVDNSNSHRAPLNYSGVCLCELMFGQVQIQVLCGGYIRE